MNRRLSLGGVTGLAALLALGACAPAQPDLDLGDLQDYAAFLDARGDDDGPEPFEAEPLFVSSEGLVRAVPDIAVITARLSAEDPLESAAVNTVSEAVNAVQDALAGFDLESGFTAVTTSSEYSEACQQENAAARRRHNEILNDFYFNQRLDQRGDTETRRRPPRRRVAETVCFATDIRAEIGAVFRVSPAEAAGDVLRALSDAGAEQADLYGYDLSERDALYQQAAAKAVSQARTKAKAIASGAGGTLGELVEMRVDPPRQTGRFGPQPRIIRPAQPDAGQTGSALARYLESLEEKTMQCPDGKRVSRAELCGSWSQTRVSELSGAPAPTGSFTSGFSGVADSIVVQEAATELITVPAQYETIYENGRARQVLKTPARSVERRIPLVKKTQLNAGATTPAYSNALTMSLGSGPQEIRVTATLAYDYDTPISGRIIETPEPE